SDKGNQASQSATTSDQPSAGQAVDPGAVGATVNSDKTLSFKGDDGKMKTLPHTGDGSSSAVMASGLAMVLSAVLLFLKTKFNFFVKKN
ncbi:LPXTG cell wall anchor domain-containing protein, partial [Streptococcus sobrinus]